VCQHAWPAPKNESAAYSEIRTKSQHKLNSEYRCQIDLRQMSHGYELHINRGMAHCRVQKKHFTFVSFLL